MLSVISRLLVLMLVVSLPIQGWASSRMALAMAIGHGTSPGASAVDHDHGPAHGAPAVHGHSREHSGAQGALHAHHGAADEPGTPPASASADCCVGHHDGHPGTHGPDSGHTPCGESCHCCISMALPALMLQLTVQNPPADWYRVADCAFTQVSAPTPDKPPKG